MQEQYFRDMFAVPDVSANWKNNRVWESLKIPVGWNKAGQCCSVDLHPRAQGPHGLFFSDVQNKKTEFLTAFLYAAATKISPEDLNFFLFDCAKGELYQKTKELPHFVGAITEFSELNNGMHILMEELRRRQYILNESGMNNAYKYIEAYKVGAVKEQLPLLFVVVDELQCLTEESQFISDFFNFMRVARCLGIHVIMTAKESDCTEMIKAFFPLKYNLDNQMTLHRLVADEVSIVSLIEQTMRSEPIVGQPQQLAQNFIWSWTVENDLGERKTLQLIRGDLCELQIECDVVVCSAFQKDYVPTYSSLIGSLEIKKGICVYELARNPELDFRTRGCWLSKETGTSFRRIACVELLDCYSDCSDEESVNVTIRKSFSTLRFILEQAEISRIPVSTVVLPVLGTGNQGIEMAYMLSTLIAQCRTILQSNDGVKKIILYERDEQKAQQIVKALNSTFSKHEKLPKVFLSYSSKQIEIAKEIFELLEKNQIPCWMAPDSIPSGSSYLEMIPVALSQVEVVLLLLTPEAEKSRWVQKEVGTAIGADKIIIPYQLDEHLISDRFRFLLDGEQILVENANTVDNKYISLIRRIKEVLKKA